MPIILAPTSIPYYEVHDNYHCTFTIVSRTKLLSHLTFITGITAGNLPRDPLPKGMPGCRRSGVTGTCFATRSMEKGSGGNRRVSREPSSVWEFGRE